MTELAILPLSTPRLVLRALRPADAAVIHGYRNDPVAARFQDWPLPFSLTAAQRLATEQSDIRGPIVGGWVQLGVEQDGELVGDLAVGLDRTGSTATVGYTLRPDRWGRGLGTEAVGALVDYSLGQQKGRMLGYLATVWGATPIAELGRFPALTAAMRKLRDGAVTGRESGN